MSNPTQSRPALDPKRELLRHTLATLAYRGGKAVRDAPDGFAEFQAGQGARTSVQKTRGVYLPEKGWPNLRWSRDSSRHT